MDGFCAKCGAQFRDGDNFCAKCGVAREGARVSEPSVDPPGERKMWASIMVGVAIAVGAAAVMMTSCQSVKGHVTLSGGSHRAFTFTPTGCASMQPMGHFGANLHGKGPNDGGLYVTIDPAGTAVQLEIPGSCRHADGTECDVLTLTRDHCRTYDPHVEHNGVEVNDVPEVKGHVRVDCTLDDGTHVVGSITFDGC